MLKTEKEYQELATFLYDLIHATNWEDDKIQELFGTFEALREVARDAKKFGEYDTANLLRVIADDYERDGSPVWKARAMWLRDLAAKFAKYELPDWLTDG